MHSDYAKKVTARLVSSTAPFATPLDSTPAVPAEVPDELVVVPAKAVMFLSPALMYSFSLGKLFQNSSETCKWS